MSYKFKNLNNSTNINKIELKNDNEQRKIKIIKRTLENNMHEVIEDTKLKNITTYYNMEKIGKEIFAKFNI